MSTMPSPCINVCRMERGLCAGCGRTLDEIAQWSVMDNEQKRAVWAVLPERLAANQAQAGLTDTALRSST
jgi:uncharacterized protein